MPFVSVVIATYNSGPYLREAIGSVLSQTVSDLELIVIDDGSTDGTKDLVTEFQDERVRYVWQKNAGQTSAKNHGVRLALGDFIGFCDGDDYWYPKKLELQLPLFQKDPLLGVAYSPADTIDQHGARLAEIIPAPYRGDVTQELFLSNFVPFGTALVRRQCMEAVGGFDPALSMGIDWDLWLRISARYHFDHTEESTYAYRIWPGQMSKNWRGRYSSAFRIMRKFLADHPGKIAADLERRAIANTLANRARARMHETPLAAIKDSSHGALLDPLEPYSWKTLGRTSINAASLAGQGRWPKGSSERYHATKRLLAPVARLLTAKAPRIFMYHRFSAKPTAKRLTAAVFRQQILMLRERCEIVSLSESMERARSRRNGRKPIAVITVDDGYDDFHEIAFPILRELDVPATLFVTTGFVERNLFLWPDQIRVMLTKCAGGEYTLKDFWEGERIRLGEDSSREDAWNLLADRLVFESPATRAAAVSSLEQSLGVQLSADDMIDYRAMSWAQLRELSSHGIEIGDHSHTHPHLPSLTADAARMDLSISKRILEETIGSPVRSFAYPNGTRRDMNEEIVRILKDLGYRQAVLSVPHRFSRENNFEIGRFSGDCTIDEFRSLIDGFGVIRP